MKNYLDKLDKYKKAVNFLTEMVNFESSFDTPLEKLNEALTTIEQTFKTTTSYFGIKQDDPAKLAKMAKLKADTIKSFNV